jgi:hypothetical protein
VVLVILHNFVSIYFRLGKLVRKTPRPPEALPWI